MDAFKFTTIAHGHMAILNPVSTSAVDTCLDALALRPGDTVIDVGCGKGEMLIRLAERYDINGIGLDTNPAFQKIAKAEASRRAGPGRITFHLTEASGYAAPPQSFAAAICFGSTHAFGDFRDAIHSLAAWIRPQGRILIAEGYWKKAPDPEYLDHLGAQPGDLEDHAGNLAIGVQSGLTPLFDRTTTLAEWDAYEDLYARSIDEYLMQYPEDPDAEAMRRRIRAWRQGYLRWGRDTLGFGAYVFEKPLRTSP
jgi:ubiquinone/menaquinone biosynthesis C-methylase UbiE